MKHPMTGTEAFSDADRMLDPAEAPTETFLRSRMWVDRVSGRLYAPRLRGEVAS